MAEKRKILYWEGSSKKDFKKFPLPVQKDMGVALFIVQLGRTPESAKPWKGLAQGSTNWYRITGAIPSAQSMPCT